MLNKYASISRSVVARRVDAAAQEEESMTAAPDPGRFKAICKQRHDWYIGTCLLMPLGFVGCIQQAVHVAFCVVVQLDLPYAELICVLDQTAQSTG